MYMSAHVREPLFVIKYFDCSVQQLQNDRLNKIEGTAKTNTVLVDDLKYKEKVSYSLLHRLFLDHDIIFYF